MFLYNIGLEPKISILEFLSVTTTLKQGTSLEFLKTEHWDTRGPSGTSIEGKIDCSDSADLGTWRYDFEENMLRHLSSDSEEYCLQWTDYYSFLDYMILEECDNGNGRQKWNLLRKDSEFY